MSAARSMSSRAFMTTWSSVATGNVIETPSRFPASFILARRARQDFFYSADFAPTAEIISKMGCIARMEVQEFARSQESRLLAYILLRCRWLGTSLPRNTDRNREHDREISHDAPCRPGRRFRPCALRRAGVGGGTAERRHAHFPPEQRAPDPGFAHHPGDTRAPPPRQGRRRGARRQ